MCILAKTPTKKKRCPAAEEHLELKNLQLPMGISLPGLPPSICGEMMPWCFLIFAGVVSPPGPCGHGGCGQDALRSRWLWATPLGVQQSNGRRPRGNGKGVWDRSSDLLPALLLVPMTLKWD